MVEKKLTDAAIKRLPAPVTGRMEYPDDLVPGLKLRVTDKGAKSWTFRFRTNGRQRRMTLGPYPRIGLADARELARGHLTKVESGIDPIEEQQRLDEELETAKREAVNLSIETVIDEFVKRHSDVKTRKAAETRRVFDLDIIPDWKRRDIRSITRLDVNLILDKIVDRGASVQANRTLSQIHKFLAWCLSHGYVGTNVASGIEKPGQETKRDRILTDAELKAIWNACDALDGPFPALIQALMCTGARRGELASLERGEIGKGVLTIGADKTKTKQEYEISLGPKAQAILADLPELPGRFLFSNTHGRTPFSAFSQGKSDLDEKSGITDWTIHDLRRTFSTGLNELEIAPHIVERLLNHKVRGTEGAYNRASYASERKLAVRGWESHIERLLSNDGTEVVALR